MAKGRSGGKGRRGGARAGMGKSWGDSVGKKRGRGKLTGKQRVNIAKYRVLKDSGLLGSGAMEVAKKIVPG